MRISVDDRWRVHAEHAVRVPLSALTVWGQMRDVRRFLTADPLHCRVEALAGAGAPLRQSTELRIHHRLLGFGVVRRGRICAWREGSGYAVSDLSMRGVRVGFPHVCTYRVEPLGPTASQMVLGARGVWTATWMPRWLVRAWLAWVLGATGMTVSREMRRVAAWRERAIARATPASTSAPPPPRAPRSP